MARVAWLRLARVVEIDGPSMLPTLAPGQRVLAYRRLRALRDGDIVVVRDPREPSRWIVKRCWLVDDARADLRGDNAEFSTDSRTFGLLRRRDIRWLVARRTTHDAPSTYDSRRE